MHEWISFRIDYSIRHLETLYSVLRWYWDNMFMFHLVGLLQKWTNVSEDGWGDWSDCVGREGDDSIGRVSLELTSSEVPYFIISFLKCKVYIHVEKYVSTCSKSNWNSLKGIFKLFINVFDPELWLSLTFCLWCILRFTARITELIKVLDDISQGHYERTMVSDQNGGQYRALCHKSEVRTGVLICIVWWLYLICCIGDISLGKEKTSSNLKPGDGKIIIQDHIIRFVLQYQLDEMYPQRQQSVCYIGFTIFFFPGLIKCH